MHLLVTYSVCTSAGLHTLQSHGWAVFTGQCLLAPSQPFTSGLKEPIVLLKQSFTSGLHGWDGLFSLTQTWTSGPKVSFASLTTFYIRPKWICCLPHNLLYQTWMSQLPASQPSTSDLIGSVASLTTFYIRPKWICCLPHKLSTSDLNESVASLTTIYIRPKWVCTFLTTFYFRPKWVCCLLHNLP